MDNEYIFTIGEDQGNISFKEVVNPPLSLPEHIEPQGEDEEFGFFEVEYEDTVPENVKPYYSAAAISGILTSCLSAFLNINTLEDAKDIEEAKLNTLVTRIAIVAGCNSINFDEATKFLNDKYLANQEKEFHSFSDIHDLYGLAFAVLAQFTGKEYGTDKEGHFMSADISVKLGKNRNFAEKVFSGFSTWVISYIADLAKDNFDDGQVLTKHKQIKTCLRAIAKLPIARDLVSLLDQKYGETIEWFISLFNGTYTYENGDKLDFDLMEQIGDFNVFGDKVLPLIANECVCRVFYMIKKLLEEANKAGINSFADLRKLDPKNFLPYNNEITDRMSLASSGAYFATKTIIPMIAKRVKDNGEEHSRLCECELSLNNPAFTRLLFVIRADGKYVVEDIKDAYDYFIQRRFQRDTEKEKKANKAQDNKAIRFLTLNPDQTRMLYSAEALAVEHDIMNSKGNKNPSKSQWLKEWKKTIIKSIAGGIEGYFIEDEIDLFKQIRENSENQAEASWLYLLAFELSLFRPYYTLSDETKKDYRGLKLSTDYVNDVFCQKQSIVSAKQINRLSKAFSNYKSEIDGSKTKKAIAIGATAVAGIATGGLAYAFAPEIAAVIAGDAVAGLYGAALSNASLALIGGGALSAGGLGVAGGTAIVTGGGAVLGLAGSGTASLVSFMGNTSKDSIANECAKLLAFCDVILKGRYHLEKNIDDVIKAIEILIGEFAVAITTEESKKKKDRKTINNLKSSQKYLERCHKTLVSI